MEEMKLRKVLVELYLSVKIRTLDQINEVDFDNLR